MKEKYIQLLEKQIEKLTATDFDLEAWKSSAISALSRIYGSNDPKIRQIENLKIDYSSWTLRDSSSKYNPVEACKRKGREILKTAIEEIELFGLDEKSGVSLERFLSPDLVRKLTDSSIRDTEKEELLRQLGKEELARLVLALLRELGSVR